MENISQNIIVFIQPFHVFVKLDFSEKAEKQTLFVL